MKTDRKVYDFEKGLLNKGIKKLGSEYGINVDQPREFKMKTDRYSDNPFETGKYYPVSDTLELYNTENMPNAVLQHLLTKYQTDLYADEPSEEYLEFIEDMYDKRDELLEEYDHYMEQFKEKTIPSGEIETIRDIEKILLMDSEYGEKVYEEFQRHLDDIVEPLYKFPRGEEIGGGFDEVLDDIINEYYPEICGPLEEHRERFSELDECPLDIYGKPISTIFKMYDSGEITDRDIVEKHAEHLREKHRIGDIVARQMLNIITIIEPLERTSPDFIEELIDRQRVLFDR